ncbi:hypothetical protein DB347_22890 [Opitutaceae bacterium EW11]|nr:hypothetical protein DB347_22890 [Opitutaceae bacterium EW11]
MTAPRVSPVSTRLAILAAVLLAGWPVLRWYGLRLGDGSDEPLGLLALGAALAFAPRAGWLEPLAERRLHGVALSLAAYSLAYAFVPPLLRAAIWVLALACCAAPKAALAWSTLLALSLPWVATVQFYLGYPLRCVTTLAAAGILRLCGLAVHAQGTVLGWAGERVLIDAPCSGIQMAWTLLAIAATTAVARGAGARESLRLFRRAGTAVLAANTVRAVALFCVEMRLWPVASSPGVHDAIGLTLFALAAWAALDWRRGVCATAPREALP